MFENLQIFRTAHAMARHAGVRQSVIARNLANADTPNYRAQDIAPFDAELDRTQGAFSLRATRNSHLNAAQSYQTHIVTERANQMADPNGNTVTLETEMLHAVDAKRQHDRALAIYKSSLTILRSAIGRR